MSAYKCGSRLLHWNETVNASDIKSKKAGGRVKATEWEAEWVGEKNWNDEAYNNKSENMYISKCHR